MKKLIFCLLLAACRGPVMEKPPCDEATLAQILATCESEEDCNKKLDERQVFCAKMIKEES